MFRKLLCAVAALSFAAMVGCSSGNENKPDSEPSAEATDAPVETTEAPTDRIRDIETTDNFEYEILEGHAVITKYTGAGGEVTVPAEIEGAPVTEVGYYAFEAKYGVTSVILPDSVELIGQFAFMDCADLQSINIPEKVKGIERGAFASCTSLESLVIPKNTAFIYEEAFTACEGMTSLTIKNPDLKYENWGLEELPELTIYAQENSAVSKWAAENGFNVSPI